MVYSPVIIGLEESKPDHMKKLQTAFAAHIRDPDSNPVPDGIEDRRMKIYRDLFFNSIQTLLAGNFPVLRAICDDQQWSGLVRDFYSVHRCQTPLFPELAKEFLRYLQDEREIAKDDPGFLLELAHYEWVELALSLDERELTDIAVDRQGDLLEGIPVLSPLAWPLSYRYPVHMIKPDYQPKEPPSDASHILVYRNRQDDVKFMKLNDVSRLLLEIMRKDPEASGRVLLNQVATAISHPQPERVVAAGADLLNDLRSRDIVLGTRR